MMGAREVKDDRESKENLEKLRGKCRLINLPNSTSHAISFLTLTNLNEEFVPDDQG